MTRLAILLTLALAGCEASNDGENIALPEMMWFSGVVRAPAICHNGNMMTSCGSPSIVKIEFSGSLFDRMKMHAIDVPPLPVRDGEILNIESRGGVIGIYNEHGELLRKVKPL